MTRFSLTLLSASCLWAADSQHGAMVLENQDCLQCHTVGGQGVGHETILPAPELVPRLSATFSPSILASVLWNHTPAMWAEMSSRGVAPPAASEADWQDLFAYLYWLRFSEPPAEVGRGKKVLEDTHCTDCHSLSKGVQIDGASAVPSWKHMDDPMALAFQMWNHAVSMRVALRRKRSEWKTLSGRDLLDITAYVQKLQNLPPDRHVSLPPAESGKALYEQTCAGCHQRTFSLAVTLRNKTFMDIAAGLWNHKRDMRTVPIISDADLRKIVAYSWQLQYDGPDGNPVMGQRAFSAKHCIACHKDAGTGAPRSPRPGTAFTPFSMIAIGWGPGRQMHQRMRQEGIDWPVLTPADVRNLAAYLNSLSQK